MDFNSCFWRAVLMIITIFQAINGLPFPTIQRQRGRSFQARVITTTASPEPLNEMVYTATSPEEYERIQMDMLVTTTTTTTPSPKIQDGRAMGRSMNSIESSTVSNTGTEISSTTYSSTPLQMIQTFSTPFIDTISLKKAEIMDSQLPKAIRNKFETDETLQLNDNQLHRLVLLEQLKLVRMEQIEIETPRSQKINPDGNYLIQVKTKFNNK